MYETLRSRNFWKIQIFHRIVDFLVAWIDLRSFTRTVIKTHCTVLQIIKSLTMTLKPTRPRSALKTIIPVFNVEPRCVPFNCNEQIRCKLARTQSIVTYATISGVLLCAANSFGIDERDMWWDHCMSVPCFPRCVGFCVHFSIDRRSCSQPRLFPLVPCTKSLVLVKGNSIRLPTQERHKVHQSQGIFWLCCIIVSLMFH